MNNNETGSQFLYRKPSAILLALHNEKEASVGEIAEATDTQISHTSKILSMLQEEGLAETRKEGRKRFYSITDKGLKAGGKLQSFVEEINED